MISNKWFDIMKWCVLVFIPALTTLYVSLGGIWGFPYATEVAKTSTAVCAFLGAILGISNLAYKQEHDILVVKKDNPYFQEEEPTSN